MGFATLKLELALEAQATVLRIMGIADAGSAEDKALKLLLEQPDRVFSVMDVATILEVNRKSVYRWKRFMAALKERRRKKPGSSLIRPEER